MKIPSFTISQLLVVMFIFAVVAAGVHYGVNNEIPVSPLVFQLMLISAPALLVVVVSIYAALTRRRK